MPSLLRLLAVIGTIGGIGFGTIYVLATFVDPWPRDMTQTVSPDKFLKR